MKVRKTLIIAATMAASISTTCAADYRRGPPPVTDYGYVGPSAPGAYAPPPRMLPHAYQDPYEYDPCRILSGPVFDAYGNPAGLKTWQTCAR